MLLEWRLGLLWWCKVIMSLRYCGASPLRHLNVHALLSCVVSSVRLGASVDGTLLCLDFPLCPYQESVWQQYSGFVGVCPDYSLEGLWTMHCHSLDGISLGHGPIFYAGIFSQHVSRCAWSFVCCTWLFCISAWCDICKWETSPAMHPSISQLHFKLLCLGKMLMLVMLILGENFLEQKMIKSVFDAFILSLFLFIQMLTSWTNNSQGLRWHCVPGLYLLSWSGVLAHGHLLMHVDQLLVGWCLV